MKTLMGSTLLILSVVLSSISSFAITVNVSEREYEEAKKTKPSIPLAIVSHHWQEKITDSNHAALRPGSIYDIQTYFEQNFGLLRPKFKYLFHDTGLGAADPIYPVYQEGYQHSWAQLIKAGMSKNNRHIDHYSTGETPEGCIIKSAYWVRHINEFPDLYKQERAEGYTLVDISFDYYIKKNPTSECGKHIGNDVPVDFDPFKKIKKYAKKFRVAEDIPPELMAQYEFKIGLLKLIKEEFGFNKWPRYDQAYQFEKNSLWYYPQGFPEGYGITTARAQKGLENPLQPLDLLVPANHDMEENWPLSRLMNQEETSKLMKFFNGKPHDGFEAKNEPGQDTFSLSQINAKNFYTSGRTVTPIENAETVVSNLTNYRLVSALVRPYEPEFDIAFPTPQKIPQLRFVFQLRDPKDKNHIYEQLYLHLIFDGVDRLATTEERTKQQNQFMLDVEALALLRKSDATQKEKDLGISRFIHKYTQRPIQTISFSTTLTGIWVFGSLSRAFNTAHNLEPVRVVRSGVDVGYYSSAYDTVLFREAAKVATGAQKEKLEKILVDLLPVEYRDPRRQDVHGINFHRVTCAQCHQMSGRDGVHMQWNDMIDSRISTKYRASEFFFRELDKQLVDGGK